MLEKDNIGILAPTSSGKTYYVTNYLCTDDNKKYLYLCDNSNLKYQIMLEGKTMNSKGEILDKNDCNELTNKFFGRRNITVMCYQEFGMRIKFNKSFINQYDLIVCDEFHNLFDYYSFSKNSVSLERSIEILCNKHLNTKIVAFTATPYAVTEMENKYPNLFINWVCKSYLNDKRIKKDISRRQMRYNNSGQVPYILKEYKADGFDYMGDKALIFTTRIKEMKLIETDLINIGLNPICIWSEHNEDLSLSDEQLRVRSYLLQTGELLEPYNVLIINRAMETGVNITDKSFRYCVVNSTNVTQQIQARGRLRFDIELLALLKDGDGLTEITVTVPDEYLDIDLTKEDKDRLVEYFNIKDNKSRIIKWTRLKKIIESSGYKVTDKQIRIEKKKTKVSIINNNKII